MHSSAVALLSWSDNRLEPEGPHLLDDEVPYPQPGTIDELELVVDAGITDRLTYWAARISSPDPGRPDSIGPWLRTPAATTLISLRKSWVNSQRRRSNPAPNTWPGSAPKCSPGRQSSSDAPLDPSGGLPAFRRGTDEVARGAPPCRPRKDQVGSRGLGRQAARGGRHPCVGQGATASLGLAATRSPPPVAAWWCTWAMSAPCSWSTSSSNHPLLRDEASPARTAPEFRTPVDERTSRSLRAPRPPRARHRQGAEPRRGAPHRLCGR